MFGFLVRSRRPASSPRFKHASLRVESLETRDCPSGNPVLSMTITPTTGTTVELTGQLSNDANPSGATVSFTGVVNAHATTDANGNYDIFTQASNLGTIYATAVDTANNSSNQAQGNISVPSPTLTFAVTYGSGNNVTLSGHITDETLGGQTVTFSGAVSGSTTTNSDGTFSFCSQITSSGSIQASMVDAWGLRATASTNATAPPVIQSFSAIEEGDCLWILGGTVTGTGIVNQTVYFGGLSCLQGCTATIQQDGSFSLTAVIPDGQSGTATAYAVNVNGQQSSTATCLIDPTSPP